MYDPAHQTNPIPYPAEVTAFADALEDIMRDRTYELERIAEGLNARGIVSGGRRAWTAESLAAYLHELANA